MHVTLVQTESSLDAATNRDRLDELVGGASPTDLVVFPEAYARDFGKPGSDLGAVAEPLDGPFVTELRAVAHRHGSAVLAGMFETNPDDARRPWNTLVLVDQEDGVTSYRKIHLYDSFGYHESDVLAGGETTPVVADVRGLRLGLMNCYDLRFPEMGRMLVDAGADVLVVPAAWVAGERKVRHWETLLAARAIENVCYVIAVGQCGERYTGHSQVISPLGDVIAHAEGGEHLLTAELEPDVVHEARETNPSLTNRRL